MFKTLEMECSQSLNIYVNLFEITLQFRCKAALTITAAFTKMQKVSIKTKVLYYIQLKALSVDDWP